MPDDGDGLRFPLVHELIRVRVVDKLNLPAVNYCENLLHLHGLGFVELVESGSIDSCSLERSSSIMLNM